MYSPKINPFPRIYKCDTMVPLRDVVRDSSLQGDLNKKGVSTGVRMLLWTIFVNRYVVCVVLLWTAQKICCNGHDTGVIYEVSSKTLSTYKPKYAEKTELLNSTIRTLIL